MSESKYIPTRATPPFEGLVFDAAFTFPEEVYCREDPAQAVARTFQLRKMEEEEFPGPKVVLKNEPVPPRGIERTREINLALYEEIVATLRIPQESTTTSPDFQPTEYGEFLEYRIASEERWVADLKAYIQLFNSSKRYGDMIYCPRSNSCVHSGVTKLLRETMRTRGLIWQGTYRIKGADEVVYHAWKVARPNLDQLRWVTVSVHDEIVATLTIPQESTNTSPEFEPVGYVEKLDYRLATEEHWVADLKEFVQAFNSSERYGDMIYCPRSNRCVHDGVTKLLREKMRSRGLMDQGAFRIKGGEVVYHAWKVDDSNHNHKRND
jgi:hypothetical protein